MTTSLDDDLSCQELVELITDYLEDALPDDARARFEAHLAACPSCATYLEQMRATIKLTGRLHEDDLGTAPRAALLEAFHYWRSKR